VAEWTDPRTWADEVLLAEQMNTDIRDNIQFLYDRNYVFKTTPNNENMTGLIAPFTSTLLTQGNDVLVTFKGVVTNTLSDYTVFDVKVDNDIWLSTLTTSSASHGLTANLITAAFYNSIAIRFLYTNVPAGIHEFRLYATTISGSGIIRGGMGLFMIEEYGKL